MNLEQLISLSKNKTCSINEGIHGGNKDRNSIVYLRSHKMNAPLPIPDKAQKSSKLRCLIWA